MTNREFIILVVLTLVAHIAVLVVLVATRRITPLLILNVLVAAVSLAYLATRLRYIFVGPDWQMLAFAAAELTALGLAAAAYRGWRFTAAMSIVVFGLHLFAAIAATTFVLLFKWDRLI
ncbi:hypothetical protein KX816_04040 [Sphingosinicellaceae bacterium]|nr:hypothetical protein KX816_04040 [Sphingosinicellaceae bacterium]